VLLFCLPLIVDGQHANFVGDVIGNSPDAASNVNTNNAPVHLYTGAVSANIPIYTLADGNHPINISLNYTAGNGVRVEDLSTSVGLGWALSGQGMITRLIRGQPDEGTISGTSNLGTGYGWYENAYNNPQPSQLQSHPATNPILALTDNGIKEAGLGVRDTEPDIFHINLPNGYSGKFYFDANGMPQLVNVADIKIDVDYNPNAQNHPEFETWTITTSDGTQYVFGENGMRERTFSYGGDVNGITTYNKRHTSAWFLTSIKSPDSDNIITYEYEMERYRFRSIGQEVLYAKPIAEVNSCNLPTGNNMPHNPQGFSPTGVTSTLIYTQKETYRISKIKSPHFQVVFIGGVNREDLDWYTLFETNLSVGLPHPNANDAPKSISEIQIQDSNGNCISVFKLHHDFYLSTNDGFPAIGVAIAYPNDVNGNPVLPDRKRLRLLSVFQENCASTDDLGKWEFEYYHKDFNGVPSGTELPRRLSLARDHWGYYNGEDHQNTLVPSLLKEDALGNTTKENTFLATRTPSFPEMKIGALTSIKRPTGGTTSFDYEPHTSGETITKYSLGGAIRNDMPLKSCTQNPASCSSLCTDNYFTDALGNSDSRFIKN
jgi:hypothetical protein